MKGTIVATWVKTVHKIWGKELAEQAMQRVGWTPDKLFMPTEEIEDDKPKKFAMEIAALTGKSEDEVWMIIGKDNVLTFFQAYPAFFRKESFTPSCVRCLTFMSS